MRALPSTRALSPLAVAVVPLAVFAAAAAFAAHEVDRVGAAETAYLGGVAAAALAAVAALAPPPALELGLGATLAVTLLWTLPDGPGRGAALGLLLAATLTIAAVRRLGGSSRRSPQASRSRSPWVFRCSSAATCCWRRGRT